MALATLSHWAPQRKIAWGVAATLILLLSFGCEGRQSTAQRLEKAYESAGMNPVTVYPLGGKITVDNEPPVAKSETARLVAIAYDAAKPDAKANSNARAFLKPDGSFELPPLPPGKYVMLFAQLGYNPRRGFFGPDGLNNLYNDPDVNSKKTEFLIDHQAPGQDGLHVQSVGRRRDSACNSGAEGVRRFRAARRARTEIKKDRPSCLIFRAASSKSE